MGLTIRCKQGHVWESSNGETRTPGLPPACPVCGSASGDDFSGPGSGTLDTYAGSPKRPEHGTDSSKPLPPRAPSRPGFDLPGYEILEELGRGGMGVVFKARHVALKRLVALKMVAGGGLAGSQQLLRFRKEAEAVARLQHPNIVQVFDVGEQEGYPYFSLELVDGGTLAAKLQGVPMEPRAAAGVAETLARAVHYAHERGIIHRDLKPANILLMKDGTPKITDFGLAKHMDQGDQATRTGVIAGTPAYMAPEQATGRSDLFGPRTDVWALGVILYELLTGKLPFQGSDSMDVIYRVANEEAASPRSLRPGLPRDLEVITLKCLNKTSADRYTSAADLADDLRRFLQHEPIRARPTSSGERFVRWVRRHPATTAVSASLLLAVSAWGVVVGARYHDSQMQYAALVAEVGGSLERTRAAVARAEWDRAAELLSDPGPGLESPQIGDEFREEAERLRGEVQRRLAARETYRQFVSLRDEALFLAAPGVTPAVREKARRAVELVEYRPGANWVPGDAFSDSQAAEILCGVFELSVLTSAAVGEVDGLRSAVRSAAEQLSNQRGGSGVTRKAFAGLELYLAGLDHFQHGKLDAALEAFTSALLVQPDRYWARYYQALCYARLGHRPELVRDALTVCLSQRNDVVWPYLQRGFAHAQLDAAAAAENDFREAERLLGDRPDPEARYVLLNNRAVARLSQGKYDDALADLGQAARIKPQMYHAFLTLAQACHQKNDTAGALRNLDAALERAERLRSEGQVSSETLALLYRTRAHWEVEGKDTATALRDLGKAAELEPVPATRARLLRDKAQLLARDGRFDDAVSAFEATLRVTPHDADVLLARAECLLNLKRWEEAEEGFTRAIAESPRPVAKALANRAAARLRRAKPDARGAFIDLSLAIELQPGNVTWQMHRGQAAMMAEDYAAAAAGFDAVLAKDPDRVEARLLRAQAFLRLGRTESAVSDAEELLQSSGLKPIRAYGAAAVLARAAGLLDRASETSRQVARQRSLYQARALEALSQLLAAMPANERAAFWRDYPARDAALASVRASDDYRRLERQFSGPTERH
jgi:eukaryotic-like serine/threonine-protein kinase